MRPPMATHAARVRPSATVILTRRTPQLEVFLVERSRRTRFFPGYHAFPGGVVEPQDGEGPDARKGAALRELFEETGVLVTKTPPPAGFPRDEATRDAPGEALAKHGLAWDLDALVDAGTLVTPAFGPLRYDTTFYVCELPAGESPTILPGELVGGAWWRPRTALRRWEEEAWPIPPPTLAYLHVLATTDDPRKAAATARATDGRPHHERFRIELHPGIYVLPLDTHTLPPATTTNCYVVDGDPILVVDPGPADEKALTPLMHTLDEMTSDGRRVIVLATHDHSDHVGGIAAVKARYRARVVAHPVTATALPPGLVDDIVQDKHLIGVGSWNGKPWRIEVLHTPGHTAGHVALRDTRWGAIIAGDMVSGVSTIMIDPHEGDMTRYMASLARLADAKPPVVLPAHGPVMPGNAFVGALEHRRAREAKVLAALTREPQEIARLLPAAYDDTPEALWPLASRSLEAHLLDLEAQGKARREGDTWRLA